MNERSVKECLAQLLREGKDASDEDVRVHIRVPGTCSRCGFTREQRAR